METARQTPYPFHWTRLGLRVATTVCLIIALGCYIADGVLCIDQVNDYNNVDYYDYAYEDSSICWTDGLYGDLRPVITVAVPMVWNIIEFIVFAINRRGVDPRPAIGFDIFWALAVFSTAVVSLYDIGQLTSGGYPAPSRFTTAAVFSLLASLLFVALFIFDILAVIRQRNAVQTAYAYNGQPSMYSHPSTYNQPVVYAQPQGPYANLPPPPPGMAYLVPVNADAAASPMSPATPVPQAKAVPVAMENGANAPEVVN